MMAVIGRTDGQSVALAIPAIVFKYGNCHNLAFDCTAVNGCSVSKCRPGHPIGGANIKCLLKLDITGSGMDVQEYAAISHFALNMVLGQGALGCDLVVVEP